MTKYRFATIAVFISALLSIAALPKTSLADSAVCLTFTSSLSIGSSDSATGGSVSKLQDFLRSQDLFSLDSTGYFGKITQTAVKDFQANKQLPAVGVVGPLTRAAIHKISCAAITTEKEEQTSPANQTASLLNAVDPITPKTEPQPQPEPDQSLKLPYRSDTWSGWEGTWANVTKTSSGSLLLKAATTTEGAEVVFWDSRDWIDYRLTANVIVSNSNITLMSRFVDDDNFLSCTFSNNWISIQKRVNGETTTLDETTVEGLSSAQFFAKSTSVSMRVKGNTIGCSEVGSVDNLTYTMNDNPLPKGGIGVNIWGVLGSATLELLGVRVEAI